LQPWGRVLYEKGPPIVALPKWSWPVDLTQYDRLEELRPAEAEALKKYICNYSSERNKKQPQLYAALHRLVRPLEDVIAHTALLKKSHGYVILFLIREVARRDRSFWGWNEEEWVETINARWGDASRESWYTALRSFGGIEQAREQCRDARGVRLIEELWQGLCYGARMLLKNPGFTSITFIEHPQSDKLAKLKRRSLPNGTFSDFPGVSIKFHIT
jgi:hypothetical protein